MTKRLWHSIQDRLAGCVAILRVGIDVPYLARGGRGEVASIGRGIARVTTLQILRVEAFGQEDDLLPSRDRAKSPGKTGKIVDLLLDSGANELLAVARQSLARIGHLGHCSEVGARGGHHLRRLPCNLAFAGRQLRDERFVPDLKRIGSPETTRIADGCLDKVMVGRECGQKAKAAIDINRPYANEISRLYSSDHKMTRRILSTLKGRRRRKAHVE